MPTGGARRRFVSLRTQLAAGMVAVVTIVSAAVFFEVSSRERESLVRSKEQAATAVADLFAATVAAPLDFGDPDAVRAELKNLEANRDVVYAAAWLAGASTPVAEIGERRHPAVDAASRASPSLSVADDAVDVARPVHNVRGQLVGATFIRFSLAAENAAFAQTRRRLFWLCLAMAIGTLALLLAIAQRQILSPIDRLLRAVRRVQRGDTRVAVQIGTHDEIGRLASAFNDMRTAIHDREESLATANKSLQELFDNMRQVIVVFGADGAVAGSGSRSAAAMFGGEVEGRRVVDLLHPGANDTDPEASALAQWIDLVFSVPYSAWSEVSRLAPREVVLRPNEAAERVLELEFRPIAPDGDAEAGDEPPVRVMLLATDETDKRRLVKEVRVRGEAHEREMAAMRQLLAGRSDSFVVFIERARARFARCEELLAASHGEPRGGALDEMLQHTHTVKGEARVFDLGELAEAMGTLEQQLRSARAAFEAPRASRTEIKVTSGSGSTREAIATGFEAGRMMITRAADLFIQVSPHGKDALDRVTVKKSDVRRLVDLTGARDDELGAVVARIAARPFGESAVILAEKVPTWAEEQKKRARLVLSGREILVPAELAKVLGGVLTHLVRNAIAHGIESPSQRELDGKNPVGEITLHCEETKDGPFIVLEDDGQGLALAEIEARARAAGIWREGSRAEDMIFTPNFSMREDDATDAAGLGVGLAAARTDLEGVGYVVMAEARSGGGTRFVVKRSDRKR
jgi:two-component system, chemotaxis family, sensor kinase CheA